MPNSLQISAGNSFALASGILRSMWYASGTGNNSVVGGGITINNTFNEANSRDGMAIIRQLNREMGAMI